jgi:glycosyltransferase involved in cell wall biosynthesis
VTIASNSDAARDAHARLGYATDRWHVIPNAIEITRYAPDPEARRSIRNTLALPDDAIVIGAIGRDVPEKGFGDLIAAFGAIHQRTTSQHILLIAGRGITMDAPHFAQAVRDTGVALDHFRLLGTRDDIPALLNACDVFVLSSRSESFPNVLAEAMATALPCVTTDVGDCRQVLKDDRFVASPSDPASLASALTALLSLSADEKAHLGAANRTHIAEHYTLAAMIERFTALFHKNSGS